MAFTIKGGKISTTDDDTTIRSNQNTLDRGRRDPVDEVIDILNQVGQDDFTAQAMSRPREFYSSSQARVPTFPASPTARMQDLEQGFRAAYLPKAGSLANIATAPIETGVRSPQRFNIDPFRDTRLGDTLRNTYGLDETAIQNLQNVVRPPVRGSYGGGEDQLSGSFTNYPGGEGYRELVQGGQGIASMFPDPTGGYATRGDPRESFAARDVAIEEIKNMNPLVKGIHNVYARMFGLGTDDQGNITPEALIDLKRQTQQTMARGQELDDDRRKDQERAERAAMLAAQNQPVDPCPEGYRMDPVSKVCVPTDDTTTDPVPGTGRVYETMTAPQENYTAASNFAVPTINLPDIFTGK